MLGGAQQRLQLVDGQAVVGLAADWAPGDQAAITQTGQVPETVEVVPLTVELRWRPVG
jgi:hypothetical protein